MRSGSRKHVLDWVERPTFHEDSGIADVAEPVSSAAKRDDLVAKPLSDVAPGITLNQKVSIGAGFWVLSRSRPVLSLSPARQSHSAG